jgi:hypothetical protein
MNLEEGILRPYGLEHQRRSISAGSGQFNLTRIGSEGDIEMFRSSESSNLINFKHNIASSYLTNQRLVIQKPDFL